MKKVAIILALMLVLGVISISGCTTNQNNTQNSSSGNAKNSSGIPGYNIGHIVNFGSGNSGINFGSDVIKKNN